ncbi:GDSL-type esterase/lipase family protein [Micromonospora sp. CA-263727]|uniref:GDSL-type esterase/lipase family protein n=1 Tax=Micromonospora sp. CA-263727 TaxID=3239967 RepID=UPI003D9142AA
MSMGRWTTTLGVLVCMMVVATSPSPPASASAARSIRWLAAGDSFSSGDGLPQLAGDCRRATGDSRTYSQVAAGQLSKLSVSGGEANLAACSGATIEQFFNAVGSRRPQWKPGDGRYDLVTLSFGGNDVRFSDVLTQCAGRRYTGLAAELVAWEPSDPGHLCPRDADLRKRIDDKIGSRYQGFLTRIANDVVNRGGNIVVLGYPALVEEPDRWTGLAQTVDQCFGIGRADALQIRGLAGHLNATIGHAVSQVNSRAPNGVRLAFLDVNSGGSWGIGRDDSRLFEPSRGQRHNQCAIDSWINGLTRNGSFHPRQQGYNAEGEMLAQILDNQLDWGLAPTAAPVVRPTISNFEAVVSGPGHVGVSFRVGWQAGQDPVTCRFFIDGREAFTAQCGTSVSKQFTGLSPGPHRFSAVVVDRFGVSSDPSPTVARTVPGAAPPPVQPATISLTRGGAATSGYWYSVTLQGFSPGSSVTVTCRDSVDPGGFWNQTFVIGGDGRASDTTLCYSADGPDHWVTGGGVESNHVSW